jgi:expansin (peptidoglycan-binding protein)
MAVVLAVGALAAAMVVQSPGTAEALPPAGETRQGEATFYTTGNGGAGNCSFPAGTVADSLFVAVNPDDYAAAGGCGGYLDVTGPSGSVRVVVTDQCPGCGAGVLDLSAEAFARIADPSLGIVPVTYRTVRDPDVPGPLAIVVKDGSNPWWIGFLVINHGNELTSVEYQDSSGGWVALAHQDYNYWLAESGAGSGPFTLRITDVHGTRATVEGITLTPDAVQDTGVWMYDGAPAAAPAADPAPEVAITDAATTTCRPRRVAIWARADGWSVLGCDGVLRRYVRGMPIAV